tara:strand:- start:44197 stop:44616 length:420 start_codon:yes stop_codon:yes gene_type:complete
MCEVYSSYYHHPNERDFLFLCFGLYHLREWILGTGEFNPWQRIEKQLAANRLAEEQFGIDIAQLEEFQLIKNFCNSGKHGTLREPLPKTVDALAPFTAGSPVGDALAQRFFYVGDRNSREVFNRVLERYRNWFEKFLEG